MEKSLKTISKEYWGNYIGPRSELVWHEKPNVKFSISIFEQNLKPDTPGGPVIGYSIYYVVLVIFIFYWVKNGNPYFALIIAFFSLILPFLADLFFYIKNSKTEYIITNDAIVFKFFNGLKYKVHAILMKDIIAVNLIGVEGDSGTLQIITVDQVDFITYSVHNQRRRDHPTIEFVDNVKLAVEIIKSRIKKNPPRKLIYKPPVLTSSAVKTFRLFIYGFIIFFLHLGNKNYLLPIFKDGPVDFNYGFHQYLFLICIASLVLSLLATHKKEGMEEEKMYPIIFFNLVLMFCYWLVYLSR